MDTQLTGLGGKKMEIGFSISYPELWPDDRRDAIMHAAAEADREWRNAKERG